MAQRSSSQKRMKPPNAMQPNAPPCRCLRMRMASSQMGWPGMLAIMPLAAPVGPCPCSSGEGGSCLAQATKQHELWAGRQADRQAGALVQCAHLQNNIVPRQHVRAILEALCVIVKIQACSTVGVALFHLWTWQQLGRRFIGSVGSSSSMSRRAVAMSCQHPVLAGLG